MLFSLLITALGEYTGRMVTRRITCIDDEEAK